MITSILFWLPSLYLQYFADNEGNEHFQRCLELGVRHMEYYPITPHLALFITAKDFKNKKIG